MKDIKEPTLFDDFFVSDEEEVIEETLNEEGFKLNNSNVIRSVSMNQFEIMSNIMKLYMDNKPFDADITYSSGGFYGKHGDYDMPQPLRKFDVYPQTEDTERIEMWGNIPLPDGSVNSIMFDPPFVISPKDAPSVKEDKDGANLTFKRFWSYYPVAQLFDSYYHWMEEINRVLADDGIAVVKCQKTISGSKQLNTPEWLWLCAESLGLDMMDDFSLVAKNRIHSGKVKKQMHSRRFESHFLVFRKSGKKKTHYLGFASEETIDKILNGFKQNNLNNSRKPYNREDWI